LTLFAPPTDAPRGDEGSRTRLFAAVTSLLTCVCAKSPAVLMIDDPQWIDEGSASLLHYVLRTVIAPNRLLFFGSARTDEIVDNSWCRRVVGALVESGAVKRLQSSPLRAEDAAQFLEAGANAREVADVLRHAGGNPLFLTELARAGQQGIAASGRDLVALIDVRIARLDDAARELIV